MDITLLIYKYNYLIDIYNTYSYLSINTIVKHPQFNQIYF
jgi:hypothetical protein